MAIVESAPFTSLLQATDSLTHVATHPPPESRDGRSKIIQGVLFSKKFIITYNIVLLSILVLSASRYWISRLSRHRREQKKRSGSRTDDESAPGVRDGSTAHAEALSQASCSSASSASSSTTGHSSATSVLTKEQNPVDETTSLLGHAAPATRSPSRVIRSWLLYQPPNIPIINKTLPSNATSIAVLLFLALNIFYLLYFVPLAIPFAFVLADRAGLLFVANLPLLYLFAAKNQPIKWLTGYSYESLNIIHRRLGEWMCFIALIHFTGMVVTWYMLLSAQLDFWRFLALPLVWLGMVTFVAYETLYLTSLGSFRQRFYELFLGLHVVLQVVALSFLFFHHPASRPYVGTALAIFVVDRIIFRLGLRTRTLKADLSIMEDGETVLLSSDWDLVPAAWWRRLHIKNGWEPTEHVFITVPALSRKHIIQAHPFTIASAAPDMGKADTTHAWLNFIIRARDGFSRDLLHYAQSHPSASVRIDGPYGSLHALEMLRDSKHAVVVAGGSGVAVAYPLLWDLLCSGARDDGRRVTLIWVVHDAAHIDWIGQDRLDKLRERGLHVIIPPPTRKAGRPDMENLVEAALTPDSRSASASVGVVVSGPDSMNRSVRNTCAGLVRRGLDVSVSVEKFGW